MLSLVTERPDHMADARDLIFLVESWRPVALVLVELVLLPLLGVVLAASGLTGGWLLIGAAIALVLSRYGPHWWPGKR